MTGWITDLFRLGWGALYWNSRKSWHSLRGRRGRCPCQVASDSGRAFETGCEAVIHFSSPGRFRTVCPLLARHADGRWVCSVNTDQVRAFWGRTVLAFLGGAIALALIAIVTVLLTLRSIGYEVTFRQVAWPPAWREFRGVQARLYLEKARADHAAGRTADALLALSNAYELNPSDYSAGILLAQLWQTGQPLLSDNVYTQLFASHPEQREQTAQSWFRALLARGDFPGIERLSGERLLHSGPSPSPAWTQAFLFATRQNGSPEPLARLLAKPDLPPAPRTLLAIELELYSQTSAQRIQSLNTSAALTLDPFSACHLLRRLLEENRPDLVLPLSTAAGSALGDREKARLQLDSLVLLNRPQERARLVQSLLKKPTHPAICELLSSHLIAFPEKDLLRAYGEKLTREPIPAGDAVYPQLLSFFSACAVQRDPDLLDTATRLVEAAIGRPFRSLTAIREALISPRPLPPLEHFLPILQPLPLEVTYALYDRLAPPPPFAP